MIRRPCLHRGLLLLGLLAVSCSANEESRIALLLPTGAEPKRFVACHGHGCRLRSEVGVTAAEWGRVATLLAAADDAPSERRSIAQAIGLMERFVGPRNGTAKDAPADVVFADADGQLDCVDEAVNTTTYLRMMQAGGLLRWHRVGMPAARGMFVDGFPHKTATLREVGADRDYAVDSWYPGNGAPAHVVPLPIWRAGWRPEDGVQAGESS